MTAELKVRDQRNVVDWVRPLGDLLIAGGGEKRKSVRHGAVVVLTVVGNIPRGAAAGSAELLGGKTIHDLPPILCAARTRYSGGFAR